MSAADKSKLDAIAEYAKNTTISATSPIVASASTGTVSLTHATSGPSSSGNTSKEIQVIKHLDEVVHLKLLLEL